MNSLRRNGSISLQIIRACFALALSIHGGRIAAGQVSDRIGVVFDRVEAESPEAKAGLRDGDVVLRCDDHLLTSPQQLSGLLRNTFSKKSVRLKLQRGAMISLAVPYLSIASRGRPPMAEAIRKSYQAAVALRGSKKFSEAEDGFVSAARQAASSGENITAAWLYQQAGFVASKRRQRETSYRWHLKSWDYTRKSANGPVKASILSALGAECRRMSRFGEAEKWYKLAVAEYQALGYEWSAANDLNNIGRVVGQGGDPARCEKFLQQALTISRRHLPNSKAVADCLNNIGNARVMTGRLAGASEYYQRALAVYEKQDTRSVHVARALNNLASLASARGELALAYEYLLRSLEIKEAGAPGSEDLAVALTNLGTVAKNRGDYVSARGYDQRALKILDEKAPNSLNMARTAASMASVCTVLRDQVTSDRYRERARKLFEKIAPNSLEMAHLVCDHGASLLARNELRAAEKVVRRGLELIRKAAPGTPLEATALLNLGEVHHRKGDSEKAMEQYQAALVVSKRLNPNSLVTSDALASIGNLLGGKGQLVEAVQQFEKSIEIIEAHRAKFSSADSRRHFVSHYKVSYMGLIRAHIALRDFAAAFTALERARARSIMDWLFERRSQMERYGPPQLLERQEQLDLTRASLYRRLGGLSPNRDKKAIAQLHRRLTNVAAQQRELELRIRSASPKYASLHYPQPLDAVACKEALDKGTLLLRYFVADNRAYLFAMEGSGRDGSGDTQNESGGELKIRVFPIHLSRRELSAKVADFRRRISKRQPLEKYARELFRHLLAPARQLVERAERLLICPDDILHMLPFAALMTGEPGDSSNEYLVDLKPLHTISSITVYAQMRKQKKSLSSPKLVAFGSPNYGGSLLAFRPNRGLTLVNAKSQKPVSKNSPPQGSASPGVLSQLPSLPGTREEVESLSKLYGQQATVLTGKDASEEAAKRATQSATMLHFACHGLVDHRDPFASAVALSPGNDEDGILRAWEVIKHLRLNCDLVVLSACNSGLGKWAPDEGVLGLTTAFQYAGTRSIVVSNWSIPDKSTAAFMSEFYTQLRAGAHKDEALRRASLAVRRRKEWQHPLHWAAFQLIGDWRR